MERLQTLQDDLGGVLDFVIDDLKSKWKEMSGGPSVFDSLKAFIAAVDWKERWLVGLLSFHALLLLTVIVFRKNWRVQGATFFGIVGVVFNAERINGLAAKHWRSFAGQPYFDGHGIFTSAVLSAPLLLAMFVILINYLLATASLLIKMKRKELQVKARQQRAGGGGAGAQAAAGQQPAAAEAKKDK